VTKAVSHYTLLRTRLTMPTYLTIVPPVDTRQRILYPEMGYIEEMTPDRKSQALVLQSKLVRAWNPNKLKEASKSICA
jgi:hypothetical protein